MYFPFGGGKKISKLFKEAWRILEIRSLISTFIECRWTLALLVQRPLGLPTLGWKYLEMGGRDAEIGNPMYIRKGCMNSPPGAGQGRGRLKFIFHCFASFDYYLQSLQNHFEEANKNTHLKYNIN